MEGDVQAAAEGAPLPVAESGSEIVRNRFPDATADSGDGLWGEKQQNLEAASGRNSVSEVTSAIFPNREKRHFYADQQEKVQGGKSISMFHTALESFVFYLYLAVVPGWIGCCLAKVPPFAFWAPSIVGAGAFWSALNIWGLLFSQGAVVDPYSALISSWAEMSLAKHRGQLLSEEERGSRGAEAASSTVLYNSRRNTGDMVKIFIATLGAASLVGVVMQVLLPGHLPYGPPITMQIYSDIQSPATKKLIESSDSSHAGLSSSLFTSLLTPLPIHLQKEAARIVSVCLSSMADLVVVFSRIIVGYAWAASTWLLPAKHQELLLQSEMFGPTFAGQSAADGGFADIVHRIGVSPPGGSFEMLLWFSRVVDVFLGECCFSCLNYMAQAADISMRKITRKGQITVTGLGFICLNVGTLAYLVGSPFCRVTGGPWLNPCFAAMVMICRRDFFAIFILLTAGFWGAFFASSLVKPTVRKVPVDDRRQIVTRAPTWEDKPENRKKEE
ncbi:hypothetical protein TGME49_278965 [Toxoplasma gondii ME49]|uniref:Transmembrane protein n=2 Tax=Toxoplasma gondii TaxID=5811 RepID=S8EW72_TOXGM|nr:hypothetical protein TGME49_278965 [Toxoplasma gondii ME49]EPT25268.1 hypothetical protein TGME49_278965 [Toxoplasma gondii ME49]ESS34592.1 putative transmembrane protein [Toxoplasma gondii VEG]CEL78722.1 TPA: hypothetical protein BN1205_029595 [Toxoplasma gondii VEG]|eukprot:XP_018635106.1 hypothetical protein TGME49_278965 [Toxoplasma gondii ME49]